MKLAEDLKWRGLIKDKTFSDDEWLSRPQTFYLGIDASAPSLTVGNLAVVLLARRLSQAGWKPVLLLGGGTSLVGDPGGKKEERQLMSREIVQKNIEAVKAQVTKLFAGLDYMTVDNYDWLSKLKYVDFLRDVGKHFSMTELMQRDFVDARMGQGGSGISYAEFSYSLIQGYDFWYLFKKHKVVMQVGGSDQWGNLLSGVSLIRKKEGQEVHAMSMPLTINKATGQKFGKSESGAVWLDANLTAPTDFYQFWLNVDDNSVEDYLKIYTLLTKAQIAEVLSGFNQDRGQRLAQKSLAYEVTKLVHGDKAAEKAKQHSASLYASGSKATTSKSTASVGDSLVDLLVKSGLCASKTEARTVLAGQGVYINDQPANKASLEAKDFVDGVLRLRRGKKLQNTVVVTLK